MKRSSTRTVVVSKSMKYVDEDTRKEFRDKRLLSLEADNYVENESFSQNNEDDAYGESEDEKDQVKKKKKYRNSTSKKDVKSKWATKPIKPLERILIDNGIYPDMNNSNSARESSSDINYHSAAATPSLFPTRQNFCSVCGYLGYYSCTRCGSRYCSLKCHTNHKETRCFKFSY